jgi:hypothetical protein
MTINNGTAAVRFVPGGVCVDSSPKRSDQAFGTAKVICTEFGPWPCRVRNESADGYITGLVTVESILSEMSGSSSDAFCGVILPS